MSPAASGESRAAKAREVLEWCRHAHYKMRSNPTGPDWVLIWAGTIALLRAVGHTLDKEDGARDARLQKEQRSWWEKLKHTKPDPAIFWDFIERDRNKLLKEAELTVEQSAEVFIQGASATALAGNLGRRQEPPQSQPISSIYATRTGQEDPRTPPPSAIYSYRMNSSPFIRQDPRDLVRDAIEWWEKQLSDIEQKATAARP